MVGLAATLGSELVAEGVETVEEYHAIRSCGIRLMQGYLLARPAFEALQSFTLPAAPGAETPLEPGGHLSLAAGVATPLNLRRPSAV